MDFHALIDQYGIHTASVAVGFISGLVFVINIEVYLVLVASLVSRPTLMPVALGAAAGQMAAKVLFYYAGLGALKMPLGRFEGKIETARRKFAEWGGRRDVLYFLSASAGVPPYYPVCIIAGNLGMGIVTFLTLGFIGRLARFLLVVYASDYVARFI